jgi:DMSO reductase anchor subunit
MAAAVAGLSGVACSAQVYAVTGRRAWRLWPTLVRFTLTALVTGGTTVGLVTAAAVAAGEIDASDGHAVMSTAGATVAASATVALILVGAFLLRDRPGRDELSRTRQLLRNQLLDRVRLGVALLTVGSSLAISAVVLALPPSLAAVAWLVASILVVGAAYVERSLFFTAAAPDRMPGSLP